MKKVSLACGQRCPEGFLGVDLWEGADVTHDLGVYPWPFGDESIEEVECSHYVEHIPHGTPEPFFLFLDELHRILVPAEFEPENPNRVVKGFATILAPYYSSIRAWQDPTHTRAISEATFMYANAEWRKANGLDHYDVHCDFDFFYNLLFDQAVATRNPEYQGMAAKTQMNAISDIMVTLMKRPLAQTLIK